MRKMWALVVCGLATLVLAGCASPISGRATLPADLPDPTKDILNGVDPCSLLPERDTLALGLRKFGLDDRNGPVCVYQTPNGADEIEAAFMLRKDMRAINPSTLGKLTDVVVRMRPAKERRHPGNASCVLYLEPQRPIVAFISVSTTEHTQDQSCQLATKAAELAAATIQERDFRPYQPTDTSTLPGGGDPCALLDERQARQFRLSQADADADAPEEECAYTGRGGASVIIGYRTQAGVASMPGEPTDTTVDGQPAQELRQPYNTFCTIVLLPEEESPVTVAVGGSEKLPQGRNCREAKQIAAPVSASLN